MEKARENWNEAIKYMGGNQAQMWLESIQLERYAFFHILSQKNYWDAYALIIVLCSGVFYIVELLEIGNTRENCSSEP